ncbi:MAG: hypothetical protein PQJ61_04770 [Spirochaetales bacterium]|uniref:Uracil-DNA glycosylase n=1 Tax=Candidatus Thalassospirochaeta sargassi TaxID=3119039 RepID=A0AAJ1ID97_9SPIO|nr:hypothetical protein [Spirochaetales bacterium]
MSNEPCFWYPVCPIKRFYDAGLIEEFWVREYCWSGGNGCVRKRMEAERRFHPDNMMPDGSIREDL